MNELETIMMAEKKSADKCCIQFLIHIYIFACSELRTKLKALCLLSKYSTTELST